MEPWVLVLLEINFWQSGKDRDNCHQLTLFVTFLPFHYLWILWMHQFLSSESERRESKTFVEKFQNWSDKYSTILDNRLSFPRDEMTELICLSCCCFVSNKWSPFSIWILAEIPNWYRSFVFVDRKCLLYAGVLRYDLNDCSEWPLYSIEREEIHLIIIFLHFNANTRSFCVFTAQTVRIFFR